MDGVKLNAIDVTRPEAGLYQDLPADVYHALDCASASRLNKLARSPAHCRHSIDNPGEQTPALAFGEAFHLCCLQPDLFRDRYVVAPKVDRRTKDGKAEWAAFQAANVGRELIGQDELDRCFGMAHAVLAHPAARLLLESRTATELSAVWECPSSGVTCKLRADALCRPDELGEQLVDLKTTMDATERGFWSSVASYGYDLQAAFYRRGLAESGRPIEGVYYVFVEKDPPHAVATYEMPRELMDLADPRIDRLLRTWAECQRSGEWGGYPGTIQRPAPPVWLLRQREEAAAPAELQMA